MPGSTWTLIDDASQLKDVRLRLLLAHWRETPGRIPDREMVTEAMVTPLAGTGGTVDYLLGIQIIDLPDDGTA